MVSEGSEVGRVDEPLADAALLVERSLMSGA
jgi:hypothetical protein